MDNEILQHREKLFYEILEHYKNLAGRNEKYLKTYERFKKGKEKFLKGWTHVQVIQNRRGLYKN